MPGEEDSTGSQAVSEELASNLGNFTLNPNTRFPSLLLECSPQQQDREKNLQGLGLGLGQGIFYRERKKGCKGCYNLLDTAAFLLQKDPQERKIKIKSKFRRLRCSCHYCLWYWDLSDNSSMENITWSRFSHKPYFCTFCFSSNFRIMMQQFGKATLCLDRLYTNIL